MGEFEECPFCGFAVEDPCECPPPAECPIAVAQQLLENECRNAYWAVQPEFDEGDVRVPQPVYRMKR